MEIAPGHVIAGKYRLVKILGTGATGTVWRAMQLGLERPVAIKLLHEHIASREDAKARFEREARVAASLAHPSSVAVLDFGDDAGQLYFVMELVEGETLRSRLQKGALPLDQAITIVRQIAQALAAAHRLRLVHRDIKPENVILPEDEPEEPAKVVDFGLAFVVDPVDQPMLGRMTHDGSVVGTPAYMSPEQVRGASMGPPSDVYSLGCVFYELIAGKPPFSGSVGEIFARHAYAPAIPLRQLPLAQPPPVAIDDLIQSMLSKSATSRPSAARIVHLLGAYVRPSADRIGRASLPVIERDGRVLSRPWMEEEPAGQGGISVGVLGAVDPELSLALATARITLVPWTASTPGAERVVWLAGGAEERAAELAAAGKIVVASLPRRDAALLPALIRAGVADAIATPIDTDDLARRLWRAERLAGEAG